MKASTGVAVRHASSVNSPDTRTAVAAGGTAAVVRASARAANIT
jgi:hypothetical protein